MIHTHRTVIDRNERPFSIWNCGSLNSDWNYGVLLNNPENKILFIALSLLPSSQQKLLAGQLEIAVDELQTGCLIFTMIRISKLTKADKED